MKHVTALAGALFLSSLCGCGSGVLAPLDVNPFRDASVRSADASIAAPTAATPPTDSVDLGKLDLLVVVDNSYSMATEQQQLAKQLERLFRSLAAGDRLPDLPAGDPNDLTRYFAPVRSLHVGVISTELAVMKTTVKSLEVCLRSDQNDDARLRTSVAVALGGIVANAADSIAGIRRGDVLAQPRPECAGREAPDGYLSFEAGGPAAPDGDAEDLALSLGCIATVGVYGCPFEQQLEAMWKAIAPSRVNDFLDGTAGHGSPSGANQGFVREDAALAVLLVSDEDDCSITEKGRVLFDTPYRALDAQQEWGSVPYNMRCARADEEGRDDLLRGVDRYVEGLKSLKPGHPERVLFVGLAGIPLEAEALIASGRYDDVLTHPDMQVRIRADDDLQPQPSCRVVRSADGPVEIAYPARRVVQLAQGLGESARLFSICRKDYEEVASSLVDFFAAQHDVP